MSSLDSPVIILASLLTLLSQEFPLYSSWFLPFQVSYFLLYEFIYTYSLCFLKFSSSPPTHWINFPQLGNCPLDFSNCLFVYRLWGSCFATFQTARSSFIAAMSLPSCLKTETCKFLEFPMPCCYFISCKGICSGLLGFLLLLLFFFFVMSHYSLSAYLYRRRFLFLPMFFGVMASVTKQTFQAQNKGHGES